jgi:hypothetical protein
MYPCYISPMRRTIYANRVLYNNIVRISMYFVSAADNNASPTKPVCRVHYEGLGITLNDLIMIDRYHCETVPRNADACITRLYSQTFAEWSVINHGQSSNDFNGIYCTLLTVGFF